MGSILREGAEGLDLKVAARLQEKGYKFYELPHVSSMVQMSVHSLSSWLSNRPPSIANVYPQLASYVKVRNKINSVTVFTGLCHIKSIDSQLPFRVDFSLDGFHG